MPASQNPLRVRWSEFDRLTRIRGWASDAERARQLNISHAHLTNLRAGRTLPGRKFIDRCVAVLGSGVYDVIFERENEAA